ncbi:DUF3592 domain-containing protein [Ruminococcus sp. 210702-SL.1.03]|jgi:hypothetical protein|uniref:DUF3592 domain-containing protein n=1 Tax=Ruminococcus sp. 210702-SL.1.03 TaxID=2883233 RepID=UPI001D08986E|nr:DUF3592 domain-containing protein [Ruminococcus sp. 210702-SL.1.03]MCB6616147.1 hypothetical protein [Ruminococcus sp. 210702-SL.1.03]
MDKSNRADVKAVCVIAGLVGTVILLCQLFTLVTWKSTTAAVDAVNRMGHTRRGGVAGYEMYYTYEVDGQVYSGESTVLNAISREGDRVRVFYKRSDVARSTALQSIVRKLFFGVVLFAMGLTVVAPNAFKRLHKRNI